MTDIVKQLRGPVLPDDLFVGQWPGEELKTYDAVRFHAADEVVRLRAALETAANDLNDWGAYTKANKARAALGGDK